MARQSEVELLKQMQSLREKSGIKQIPFSNEEINSGMAAAVASAMGSKKPQQQEKPQNFKTLRQELHTPTPPMPATHLPLEKKEIPSSIGKKPLNHKRTFSVKG